MRNYLGRSSDLFRFLTPSHIYQQWQMSKTVMELTAAGTVPDSHRIPFSDLSSLINQFTQITKATQR
jgi:hypothetical protein